MSVRPFISLHHLKSLRLEGNPWHCDCKLRDLWHWLQAKRLLLTFNSASCASPTTLKGKQHTSQFYSFCSTKMSRLSWNDSKIIIFHSNDFLHWMSWYLWIVDKTFEKVFLWTFLSRTKPNILRCGNVFDDGLCCIQNSVLRENWVNTKYNLKYNNKYWIIPLQLEVASLW